MSSMDFKEYQRCLAFCAMSMFRRCAQLSAAERIATFLDLYLDEAMNLSTAASLRTPAEAIAAALKVRPALPARARPTLNTRPSARPNASPDTSREP